MQTVIAVNKSRNKKTGIVAATYAPIQTCPKTCPFLDFGCYAQTSFCGMNLKKLNEAAEGFTIEEIAKHEAKAIDSLSGERPLRLHVVGDCITTRAANIVAHACMKYMDKHNQPVWTYTHAWREVPREIWKLVSVLASCESKDDINKALSRGYTPCLVVPAPIKRQKANGLTLVPCLEMSKGIQCNKCQLCFDDRKLFKKKEVICFWAHGSGQNKVKEALERRSQVNQ